MSKKTKRCFVENENFKRMSNSAEKMKTFAFFSIVVGVKIESFSLSAPVRT